MKTCDEIFEYLKSRFRTAEVVLNVAPPDLPTGREAYACWIGVRFAPGDTCYVGVTREAEDHHQDLGRQLEESIDRIAAGSGAIVILHDRSNDARYQV